MNRHDRRTAAAKARAAGVDRGFARYRAQARRAVPQISDRDLGESWMRGQLWSASGAEGMEIHRKGETAAPRGTDVQVSMHYGPLNFSAWIDPELLPTCITEWEQVLNLVKPGADKRAASKEFLLDRLVRQHHGDGDTAGTMVGAIVWLIAGTPFGKVFSESVCPYTRLHYEVSDIEDDTGRCGQNFRLVLGSANEPLPDLVKTLPPMPHDTDREVHALPPIDAED